MANSSNDLPAAQREELSAAAWQAREAAHVHGPTKVGVAVLAASGGIYVGCNVEHRFRSHDVHAEVNALTSMVAATAGPAVAVLVASTREHFTPCGACVDWIFELGGPDCIVVVENRANATGHRFTATELMPHYPY